MIIKNNTQNPRFRKWKAFYSNTHKTVQKYKILWVYKNKTIHLELCLFGLTTKETALCVFPLPSRSLSTLSSRSRQIVFPSLARSWLIYAVTKHRKFLRVICYFPGWWMKCRCSLSMSAQTFWNSLLHLYSMIALDIQESRGVTCYLPYLQPELLTYKFLNLEAVDFSVCKYFFF